MLGESKARSKVEQWVTDYRDMIRLLLLARKDDEIDKEIKKSLELYGFNFD